MSFNSVISVFVFCLGDLFMFEVVHSSIVEVNLRTLISEDGVLYELVAVNVCCGVHRLWSLNY